MTCFLPPANEDWGKVIFSQASVCARGGVFVQGEGVYVQWGGLCPVGGSLSRGVSVQGVSVQEGLCPGGLCQGDPRTVKSGRYASYWNAFLLFCVFVAVIGGRRSIIFVGH